MTRSEALEAMARGMEAHSYPKGASSMRLVQMIHQSAQAALQALEEGGVLLSFEGDSSSREPSQSTTVAPPSGLAGPQSSGAEG